MVLDGVLLSDEQGRTIRLEDYDVRGHCNGLGVLRGVEYFHLQFVCSGRNWLVKIDPPIDRSHKHGLCAERGMLEGELPLRVGLGIDDGLHATLQLNQNDVDASRGFACRSVLCGTVNCAGLHAGNR
jgi:hypothetical protein